MKFLPLLSTYLRQGLPLLLPDENTSLLGSRNLVVPTSYITV